MLGDVVGVDGMNDEPAIGKIKMHKTIYTKNYLGLSIHMPSTVYVFPCKCYFSDLSSLYALSGLSIISDLFNLHGMLSLLACQALDWSHWSNLSGLSG